jgi:transposase-like protein
MKNSKKVSEPKVLNRLFKNSFKKKLIQQIEAKELTTREARLTYGVSSSLLSDWKQLYGEKAKQQRRRRLEKSNRHIQQSKANIEFWKEFKKLKTEAEIYKTLVDLAERRYKINLKKNYGL